MFGEYYNFYCKIINMKWKWNEWLIFNLNYAIQKDIWKLFLFKCLFKIKYLLPEKSRSILELNKVKRNFDGSLKTF